MLLIDAYNVLHVTGILPPDIAGPDVVGLAEMIMASRWGAGAAMIVCDGPDPARRLSAKADRAGPRTLAVAGSGGVLVVYAGAGRDADSHIERLLLRHSAPRTITVVSSDRRLRHAARQRRARWMTSESFLRQLAADLRSPPRGAPRVKERRPPVPLDAYEVARWMEEFGIAEGDAPASPGGATTPPSRSDASAGAKLRTIAGTASSVRAPEEARGRQEDPADGLGAPPGAMFDPILLEAMKEWRGRLKWDDLNMDKWLESEAD